MKAFWLRLLIIAVAGAGVFPMNTEAGEKRPLVLVTTYPLYQIARVVTLGHDGFDLELLLAPDAGCPHGYALTPGEMATLARADALIINGLGMEDFLDAALESAGGGIAVFDTSKSVDKSLYLPAEEDAHGGHGEEEFNPHLYASPLARVEIAAGMAEYFAEIDPDGAGVYLRNARFDGEVVREVVERLVAGVAKLPNRRIIASRGEAEYFARDAGLEIVGRAGGHDDAGLSAAGVLELTRAVAEKDPGVLALEAEYPAGAAETLREATGLPVVRLAPLATGDADAPVDGYAFIRAVWDNLFTLARALDNE